MSEAAAEKAAPLALMACKVFMREKAISSAAKAVVAVLLDRYNWKTGRCDPGLASIAKFSGCSRSGVRKAIDQLVATRLLKVLTHGSGSARNFYEFDWDLIRGIDEQFQVCLGYAPNRAQGVPQTGHRGVPQTEHGGVPQTGHQTRLSKPVEENPSKEPESFAQPPSQRKRRKRLGGKGSERDGQRFMIHSLAGGKAKIEDQGSDAGDLSEKFDQFWAVYPRHVGKKAAVKVFERIVTNGEASVEELIAGARRYADLRAGEVSTYTKYPAAWLGDGRWMDEPALSDAEGVPQLWVRKEDPDHTIFADAVETQTGMRPKPRPSRHADGEGNFFAVALINAVRTRAASRKLTPAEKSADAFRRLSRPSVVAVKSMG